jgi:hypothetical protein
VLQEVFSRSFVPCCFGLGVLIVPIPSAIALFSMQLANCLALNPTSSVYNAL